MAKAIQFGGENRIFVGQISSIANAAGLRLERRLQLRFPSNAAAPPPPRLGIRVKLSSFDSTCSLLRSNDRLLRESNFEGLCKVIIRSLREIGKSAVIVAVLLALMISGRRSSALALTGGIIAGGGTSSSVASSSSSSSSWSSSTNLFNTCDDSDDDYDSTSVSELSAEDGLLFFCLLILIVIWIRRFIGEGFYCTVIKIQVATLDSDQSIQGDLNRIAETADASTVAGRRFILEETLKSLFQHFDDCVAADSYVNSFAYGYDEFYDRMSLKERRKFDQETLVNIDGNKKKSTSIKQTNWLGNEYTVVTVLILASGTHTFPIINSKRQLRKTLKKLQQFPSNRIMQLQVLWAPQQENDSLSHQELYKRYPDLRRLKRFAFL